MDVVDKVRVANGTTLALVRTESGYRVLTNHKQHKPVELTPDGGIEDLELAYEIFDRVLDDMDYEPHGDQVSAMIDWYTHE